MKKTYTTPTLTDSGLVVRETLGGSDQTKFENSGLQYRKVPGGSVGFEL
jgi:hypothetical protein